MQMQIVQDLAHFFSGQLLFQSIAGEVSNLRGLLFSIGKEKMDNLHPPFFPLQRCAKCCFSNTVWEKENGRPSCCHLSARKKTRDNHDFNPQSSCLMPQASCTANRAFSLWRINVRTNVMSRNSWMPWVRHTLIHRWINPAMGEILQDHLRKKNGLPCQNMQSGSLSGQQKSDAHSMCFMRTGWLLCKCRTKMQPQPPHYFWKTFF